jgi:hypothetical protein
MSDHLCISVRVTRSLEKALTTSREQGDVSGGRRTLRAWVSKRKDEICKGKSFNIIERQRKGVPYKTSFHLV